MGCSSEMPVFCSVVDKAVSSAPPEPIGVLRANALVSFGLMYLGPVWADFMQA